MKKALRSLAAFLLLASTQTLAQELTLRAGELLACTLEEPNLSSTTAIAGEPVVPQSA